MNFIKYILLSIICLTCLSGILNNNVAFGWDANEDGYTLRDLVQRRTTDQRGWGAHPYFAQWAINLYERKYPDNPLSDPQKDAIIWGSIEEDYDINGTGTGAFSGDIDEDDELNLINYSIIDYLPVNITFNFSRSFNHFYPRLDGLRWRPFTNDEQVNALKWVKNENGKNLRGYDTAVGQKSLDESIAWRSLGHAIHLLCDMAVPAHVRQDPHPWAKPLERAANQLSRDHPVDINNLNLQSGLTTIDDLFNDLSYYTANNHYSIHSVKSPGVIASDFKYDSDSGQYYFTQTYNGEVYKLCRLNTRGLIILQRFIAENLDPSYWFQKFLQLGSLSAALFIVDEHVAKDQYFILAPLAVSYAATLIKQYQGESENTGTLAGLVKDAVTNQPISGVTIAAFINGIVQGNALTDSNGNYTINLPEASGYELHFAKQGYMEAIYYNEDVVKDQTRTLQAVLQIDEVYAGPGNISGTILNAFDGNGVANATINIRSGINNNTGAIIGTVQSNSSGEYSIVNINAGHYTGEASADGYTTGYFTITCLGGQNNPNQNGSITPIIPEGQIRIILTWGATPRDLDSHLTGPTGDGADRFHIAYFNKTYYYGGTTYADLDLDDVTSYGPETTTIYIQTGGIYRFSVHDFSNRNSASSAALANSGAQVKVYSGSSLAATFNVPNQEGTLWTVFELNGNIITPKNEMSYESNPDDVRSPDADIFRNLPMKY